MNNKTLIEFFYDQEKKSPDAIYLRQPFGDKWEEYTWGEVGQMARKLANYLLQQNLKPKSHIGLVSKNCREWIISDIAIMMAGFVSVPFFPTLTGEQISEVLKIGDVDLLIVGKMENWEDMGTGVPDEMPIIAIPNYEGNSVVKRGKDWDEIMAETEPLMSNHVPDLEDLWTIIFTSGTTGTPKGVMHTYGICKALIEEVFGSLTSNPLSLSHEGDNRFFSFLPLNHIAERIAIDVMSLRYGGSISFTESIDRFAANLSDVKPTLFFAVPRIWTKFRLAILNKMPQKKLNLFLKIPILKNIVKKKISTGLGLEHSRCSAVGAAPIAQETKDWFASLGVPITEGYGMTENNGATSFLYPHEDKPGSVGRPHNGTEIKIAEGTNEILIKSNYLMKGYYKDPEKTAETIVDGWYHSGDQGKVDSDGYIYITGRVKDTFKTAKAEFIVPAEIEKKFETCNDIEQMCLLGLGMPQPLLTVSLSESAMKDPKSDVKARLVEHMGKVNETLASYAKVGTIVIMEKPFCIEEDTLTPTLKVKRPQIHDKFKSELLKWCEDTEKVIWL